MITVSVLMSVYDGEKFLREAIESVLDQTFKDFELLIVDDGSTDSSIKIAESFADQRIRIIRLPHGGIVKALNYGIQNASGEYIIRADADDVSLSTRFERLVNYMEENKEVEVCGSWAISINEKGENLGEMKYPPIQNKEIRKYAVLHNPFIHPSVIFRRKILDEVGGYRNFKHTEDYELWTRILSRHQGHNLGEFLLKYRVHHSQITKKKTLVMRCYGFFIRLLAIYRLGLRS